MFYSYLCSYEYNYTVAYVYMYVLICLLFYALGYHNPNSINIEIDLDGFNGNLDKLLISINDVELL